MKCPECGGELTEKTNSKKAKMYKCERCGFWGNRGKKKNEGQTGTPAQAAAPKIATGKSDAGAGAGSGSSTGGGAGKPEPARKSFLGEFFGKPIFPE